MDGTESVDTSSQSTELCSALCMSQWSRLIYHWFAWLSQSTNLYADFSLWGKIAKIHQVATFLPASHCIVILGDGCETELNAKCYKKKMHWSLLNNKHLSAAVSTHRLLL